MGRFDPKLSDEMRAAAVRAQLEDGMSAPETVKAAAAGELGDPFEVSESTCRRLAREARKDRQPASTPAGDDDPGDTALEVARKTIARVAALDAPTSKDLHALQVAQRIVDGAERKSRHRPSKSAEEGPPGEPSPLTRMLLAKLDEEETARAEGRPCTCRVPVPRSWHHDEHDNPICHGCRLSIPMEQLAGEQKQKDEGPAPPFRPKR